MLSLDGVLLLEPGEVAELVRAAWRCVPDGPAQHPRDLFLAAVADALERAAGLDGGEPVGLAVLACSESSARAAPRPESSAPEAPPAPARQSPARPPLSA